jgi:signal transduction histidine kinase
MPKTVEQNSIRSILFKTIMLITAICLLLSLSISTYLSTQEQKKQLISKLVLVSEIIAFDAMPSLLNKNRPAEERRLKLLQQVSSVTNLHIYALDEQTNKPVFFTSFNARKSPPVPIKTDSINDFIEPQVGDEFIEYITPILNNDQLLGYVYIRGSLDNLNELITKKIIIDIAIIALILIFISLIILRLQKRIASPIENLSLLLQNIAKNHNYYARAPLTNLTEITRLSNSLNVMLARTQRQIERHEEDKKEIIGLGITGSTLLRDKLAELQINFQNKSLTASQFEQFTNDGIENLDLIYSSLNRVAELISNFKKVAVIKDDEITSTVHLQQLINDTLLSMGQELRIKNPKVLINCPADLTVESKKGPLQQVFHQLILNSLLHGFVAGGDNVVQIDIVATNTKTQITYTDNGLGVDSNIRAKIFDPFVTSKRGQGASGLGMHLVYNLVTQALAGEIVLDTEYQSGARFIITLF